MRLVRPGWSGHHDENRVFEVYSVDVSNDNQRLVTGGLDSKVKIWSAASAAHPDEAEGKPKLLASMAAHTGAVTVVKFSPDNRFIASGSDDRIVSISELDPSRQPRKREFGSPETDIEESEVWTPRKRSVGHDNDVQDLAWSPDGQSLVSVGLDSAIIVWSGQTFEKLKRLDWHQSHVKGVAFDPANKFFVTCSDDRTARIVRYSRASPTESSFSVEAVVSSPFTDSPLTSYFRRCSWSPDGETIVCPNATNGPIPTAAVIERGQWSSPLQRQVSLVGHEGTTEVARFSPRSYKQPDGSEACIVATAGEDGRIAVWSTSNPRPLVIVQNVASKFITDLAWSRSGTQSFASSLDGTVVLLQFGTAKGDKTNDGLGEIVSLDKTLERLTKYGNATDLMDIPQSVAQIEIEKKVEANRREKQANPTGQGPAKNNASTQNAHNPAEPSPVDAGSTGSVGSTTKAESPPEDKNNEPNSDNSGSADNQKNSESSKTRTVPSNSSANADLSSSTTNDSLAPTKPAAITASEFPATIPVRPRPVEPTKQKTSVTKDGRRRVTPMSLNAQPPEPSVVPPPNSMMRSSAVMGGGMSRVSNLSGGIMPVYDRSVVYDRASAALPPGGINSSIIGNKRRSDDEPMPPKRLKEDTSYLRPVVLNPSTTVSQIRLATPRVISHLSSDLAADAVLEARNASKAGEPTRVTLVMGGHIVFTDFIAEYASLLAGSIETFWAVASDTGVIYLYSPQGTRIAVPIVVGSPIAISESNGFYLCALTATGLLHAWDFTPAPGANMSSGRALFPSVSIGPCLDLGQKFQENGLVKGPQVTQCWITDVGECSLSLSSGSVFHYNRDMMSWSRVSESFWAYGSQFWDSSGSQFTSRSANRAGSQASSEAIGPVIQAELRTNEEALLKAGARGRQSQRQAVNRTVQAGYQGFEQCVSTSHLANRIAAARESRSPELPRFVIQFVRKLAERGDRSKLGELFRDLKETPDSSKKALDTAAEFKGTQELVAEYMGLN